MLECIPFPSVLEKIQTKLADIVKDIPSKPEPVRARVKEEGMPEHQNVMSP